MAVASAFRRLVSGRYPDAWALFVSLVLLAASPPRLAVSCCALVCAMVFVVLSATWCLRPSPVRPSWLQLWFASDLRPRRRFAPRGYSYARPVAFVVASVAGVSRLSLLSSRVVGVFSRLSLSSQGCRFLLTAVVVFLLLSLSSQGFCCLLPRCLNGNRLRLAVLLDRLHSCWLDLPCRRCAFHRFLLIVAALPSVQPSFLLYFIKCCNF